jgi:nucleotide-binding universal stress UspA family protein
VPIKNIVVGLSARKDDDSGSAYAVSMAGELGAQVNGIVYALEPPPSFTLYPEFKAEIIQRYRDEGVQMAEKVRARFLESAKKARVTHDFQVASGTLEQSASDLARRLRTADIAVLGQHEPGIDHVGDVFAEAALFHSGLPVIVVPRNHTARFAANRVLIAWDDSRQAARAVASAMPLLEKADEVAVLSVREDPKGFDLRGSELVRHLARHGIQAELAVRSESANVAALILREAEAGRAALVVMGAYGHSRLREFVFGGTTRQMLKDASVPVLMAH